MFQGELNKVMEKSPNLFQSLLKMRKPVDQKYSPYICTQFFFILDPYRPSITCTYDKQDFTKFSFP